MLRNLNNPTDRYLGTNQCGVLGSSLPSTGTAGPGYMYPVVQADSSLLSKQVRGKITRQPSVGTLLAFDDSSFIYTRGSDGTDSFDFQPYVNGIPYGSEKSVVLTVGAPSAAPPGAASRTLRVIRLLGF